MVTRRGHGEEQAGEAVAEAAEHVTLLSTVQRLVEFHNQTLQAAIETQDDFIVLHIDSTNAFNSVDRSQVLNDFIAAMSSLLHGAHST